jgi:hypothetical protein
MEINSHAWQLIEWTNNLVTKEVTPADRLALLFMGVHIVHFVKKWCTLKIKETKVTMQKILKCNLRNIFFVRSGF